MDDVSVTAHLDNVAVIGAGGKMGRGIALLLLQEMAMYAEAQKTRVTLTLIDSNEESLHSLKQYLRSQLLKFAERNIVRLRDLYQDDPNLISNEEIIRYFVERAFDYTNFTVSIEGAKHAKSVFEAVIENASLKIELFKKLSEVCSENTFFLTNTSSIPISYLNEKASLDDRIIGFHFYNPPAVQKLLEIIPPEKVNTNLLTFANELALKLGKTVVHSSDRAGFIGNGHFAPEGIFACHQVEALIPEHRLCEAIYMINKVTQDFLIRPMGIFQLIDYVGIDVFWNVSETMKKHLDDPSFYHSLINVMAEKRLLGGQHPDGTQKNGFFQYEGAKVVGYYNFEEEKYQSFESAEWVKNCDKELGALPEGYVSWKQLIKDPQRDKKLELYFRHLLEGKTLGEELALKYLKQSFAIAQSLVDKKVAESLQDVGTVLKTGFYHLYGPDSPWLQINKTVGICS